MENVRRTYLPAAGHDWALPLYDPFVKVLGADKVRRTLLDQALWALLTGLLTLAAVRALWRFLSSGYFQRSMSWRLIPTRRYSPAQGARPRANE
jgi:hypothetical protein